LAISSYETAVQQDPNYYMTYLLLGSLYEYENDPICLEKYTTAYQLQPKNVEVIYALAFAKEKFGQEKSAQLYYRKMTKVDSTFADGYFHLGYLAQFSFNQPDSAMYFYKKAVKVNPQHLPSFHNMGLLYEDRNDLSNALFSYAKALKVDSTYQLSRDRVNVLRKKI
jgi:tetratricopeptide (TPR) repeat protein